MVALEGGGAGAGGGAMSGAAGAAGGFLTVLGATQGLGPWQGISDFFDGFNSPSKLQRHAEARLPRDTLSGSINTFLNENGLGSYKTSGKGSVLHEHDAFKNKNELDKIIQAVKEKHPGYKQMEYAEMFKRNNMDRFMPGISVGDAKESRKQEILNPEQNPEWIRITEELKSGKIKGHGINNALAALREIENEAASLRENPNCVPKELKAPKGSNPETRWGGRRTDMTMEGFFKNLKKAIDNNTFLPEWARQTTPIPDATLTGGDPRLTDAGRHTPKMPTVQGPEPSTEPGLITEPEPTPVETPPDFEPQVPQVPQWTDEPLIPPGEEQPVLQGPEEPPEVPPEEESPSLPPGLSSLLNLIKPKLEESGLGLSDILPSLGLEFPSLSLGGFVNRSAGGFGLTPVPPPPRTELPTEVQFVRGIPLGKFEYKDDDYVGYPLL